MRSLNFISGIICCLSILSLNYSAKGQSAPVMKNETVHVQSRVVYVKRILILGDSHLLGNWGEMLQKSIHDAGQYDILSIAIGGAGSKNFTLPLRNNCCGYAIRESQFDEVISGDKRVRKVEWSNTLSGEMVGKQYQGKLENVCRMFDPHFVVIALGHNNINDHQNLINIVKAANEQVRIIWVAPFKNISIDRQLSEIQKVVKRNSLNLIRSDDILGSDTARCTHFYGNAALKWAKTVSERMKPYLSVQDSGSVELTNYVSGCQFDTLPFFLRYIDAQLFVNYTNPNSTVFQVITDYLTEEPYLFSPSYLYRLYSHYYREIPDIQMVYDIDGNSYRTLKAGNSLWMAENLQTRRFRDGTTISLRSSQEKFLQTSDLSYYSTTMLAGTMNTVYSWNAVEDERGLCPEGWHIPDIADWIYLTQYISPELFFNLYAPPKNSAQNMPVVDLNQIPYFWTINPVRDYTKSAWVAGYKQDVNELLFLNRSRSSAFHVRCVMD